MLLALPLACTAQEENVRQPDVLLVQLSSQKNRLLALEADGRHMAAEKLKQDAQAINTVIRNDFTDHYSFCPVFFFMDTNLAQVKAGNFAGILMDSTGRYVPAPPLAGKRVQVAFYGYPKVNIPRVGRPSDKDVAQDFESRFGEVWVLQDASLEQVAYSKPPGRLDPAKEYAKDKRYHFRSRKFDLEYKPIAHKVQEAMYEMAPR